MNTNQDLNKRISWRGLNKELSGTIVGEHKLGYLVQLDNGKYVVVHPDSIDTSTK